MPDSVECLLEVDEVVKQVALVLEVFLSQHSAIEDLFHSASPSSKSCLFFCEQLFCDWFQAVENDPQQYLAGMADEADCSVVLTESEVAFLGERNDKRLCPLFGPLFFLLYLLAKFCQDLGQFFTSIFQQFSRDVVYPRRFAYF